MEPDLEDGTEIDTVDQLYAQVLAENQLMPEGPCGYSCLAVMDGKTMCHRVCCFTSNMYKY